MDWVKRNLFLAGGGAVFLILLVLGGWWSYGSLQRNRQVEKELDEAKQLLTTLSRSVPYPDRTNAVAMRAQLAQIYTFIDSLKPFFAPVKTPLVTTDAEFKSLLETTLAELRQQAKANNVALPTEDYAFSFEVQTKLLSYAPGSYPILPIQLTEVRTICEELFKARIRRLLNVRRVPTTANDQRGASDYIDLNIRTNRFGTNIVLIKPYQVRFHCYSQELGSALENLARSPHGLTVRAVAVRPAPEEAGPGPGFPGFAPAPEPGPGAPPPFLRRGRGGFPPSRPGLRPPRGAGRPPAPGPRSRGEGGDIVLDERRLEITLFIDVISMTGS